MSADLESRLRALPDRLAGLHAPADLAAVVRGRHRRRRRLLAAVSAAAVLALLAGTTVAVGTLRDGALPPTAPTTPPRGPAPTDPHLLRWPTRGPLAGDTAERAAVLRGVDAAARSGRDSLRRSTEAPTHILWLGPAYPQPLPVATEPVAVIQQWDGRMASLRVLERSAGAYRPAGGVGGWTRWASVYAQLWVPTGCQRPPAGVFCPRRFAMVLLTAPGTRRISYTADPREALGGAVHPERWRDLETVDGYAFVPVLPDDLKEGHVQQVRLDGGAPRAVTGSVSGELGPASPDEPSPTATPLPDPGASQVDWLPIRGLPQLLDSPETYPGLDLWGRLHGQPGRSAYGNPLWGGTLADGSRAVVAQPVIPYETPHHLVFAVNPPPTADTKDTFLVRDLPVAGDPEAVMQVSAFLPLSDGRCELVVIGKPGTTRIRYAEDGRAYTDLPVRDGVASRVVAACAGHQAARISVRRGSKVAFTGPVDSTRPGAGVKRG